MIVSPKWVYTPSFFFGERESAAFRLFSLVGGPLRYYSLFLPQPSLQGMAVFSPFPRVIRNLMCSGAVFFPPRRRAAPLFFSLVRSTGRGKARDFCPFFPNVYRGIVKVVSPFFFFFSCAAGDNQGAPALLPPTRKGLIGIGLSVRQDFSRSVPFFCGFSYRRCQATPFSFFFAKGSITVPPPFFPLTGSQWQECERD